MNLPVLDSAGPLLDRAGRPIVRTRKQTEHLARRLARELSKPGGITWHGCVGAGPFEEVITGAKPRYYRISFGAQPS